MIARLGLDCDIGQSGDSVGYVLSPDLTPMYYSVCVMSGVEFKQRRHAKNACLRHPNICGTRGHVRCARPLRQLRGYSLVNGSGSCGRRNMPLVVLGGIDVDQNAGVIDFDFECFFEVLQADGFGALIRRGFEDFGEHFARVEHGVSALSGVGGNPMTEKPDQPEPGARRGR